MPPLFYAPLDSTGPYFADLVSAARVAAVRLLFGRRLADLIEVIRAGAGAATGTHLFIFPLLGKLILAPPDDGAHGQDQHERGEQAQQPDGHDLFSLMVMTCTVMASVMMAATALLACALTALTTSMALPWAICLMATTGATVT